MQIRELKSKLRDDNSESNASVEEEEMAVAAATEPEKTVTDQFSVPPVDFNYEASLFPDFKDGSSDSDSSAILNEDYSSTAAISSPPVLQNQNQFLTGAASPSPKLNCGTTALNYLQFQKGYQQNQMFPKMEEHNFFSGEEACNFFSDEQAPTLHWWS